MKAMMKEMKAMRVESDNLQQLWGEMTESQGMLTLPLGSPSYSLGCEKESFICFPASLSFIARNPLAFVSFPLETFPHL